MASIQRRGKAFSILFRDHEKRQRRIACEDIEQARSIRATIEAALIDVRLGRLSVPDDADPVAFLASGGRIKPVAREKPAVTFSEAAREWHATRRAAETTKAAEERHVRYLKARFRNKPLDGITTADVQAYINARPVSGITIRKELITLRSILKANDSDNVRWDRLTFPTSPVKPRFSSLDKAIDGRRALLSDDDVAELIRVVRKNGSPMIADALALVAVTGCRRSEVCRITADDVDLAGGTIVIHERKRRHGHETTRMLPIHSTLRPIIERRLEGSPRHRALFTSSVHTLASGLREALKGTRFDVRGLSWHALRHSLCSRLLSRGVAVTTVADIAGHATPATTLAVYSHAFDCDVRAAVDLL